MYIIDILFNLQILDPYERRIAISILNQVEEINYSEFGGIKEAERKGISIYPHYYEYNNRDSGINALMIYDYIGKISHRDFLGSVLALGINREKIGDILIHEKYTQIVAKEEISDFILMNLKKIGKENIKIKEIPIDTLKPIEILYRELVTTVSSLRLDAIISGALNLSRKIVKGLLIQVCKGKLGTY